jgi:hypothetical protein
VQGGKRAERIKCNTGNDAITVNRVKGGKERRVSTHRTLEERNGALWFNLERLYDTVVICLGKVLGHLLLLDEPVHTCAVTATRGWSNERVHGWVCE